MSNIRIEGVVKEGNRLFTTATVGQSESVYGEKIVHKKKTKLLEPGTPIGANSQQQS